MILSSEYWKMTFFSEPARHFPIEKIQRVPKFFCLKKIKKKLSFFFDFDFFEDLSCNLFCLCCTIKTLFISDEEEEDVTKLLLLP
jgi:hypothetical protein